MVREKCLSGLEAGTPGSGGGGGPKTEQGMLGSPLANQSRAVALACRLSGVFHSPFPLAVLSHVSGSLAMPPNIHTAFPEQGAWRGQATEVTTATCVRDSDLPLEVRPLHLLESHPIPSHQHPCV